MLEGLRVLGRAALESRRQQGTGPEEALLHALVKTSNLTNYQGLVHLKLVPQGERWALEADVQEVDPEALYQALWLGHAPRNKAQNRVTVARLEYLISQALPALAGRIDDGLEEGALRQALTRALDTIAMELPGRQERYRWVWDLDALGWSRWEWVPKGRRKELEALKEAPSDTGPSASLWRAYARQYGAKRAIPVMAAMVEAGLREHLGLDRRANYLYTLHLDGRWLAREPAYHRLLYRYYLDELFAQARPGTCYVCGRRKERLTQDTSRFWLKFYITDKPGFASGFVEANFYRNYRLCPECYQVLLAGEAFLRSRLRSRLGTPVYVVPVFHHPQVQPKGADLETWAEYIADRWQASLNLKGWQAFQDKLQQYRRYEERKAAFLLDFLFVEDDGRSVKLQYYIRDVPPSRLDEIDRARRQVRRLAQTHLVPVNPWDLGLGVLFYLFPVGQRGQGRKAFFQFLEALLTQRPVPFRQLIPLFLETASVHRFQKYGAYVHTPPPPSKAYSKQEAALHEMRKFLVQTQLLRNLLSRLNLLIPLGGAFMNQARFLDEIRHLIPEATWEYMQALDLSLPQSTLFLLGVLVGEVAQRQESTGSTPILNKIHFQGMTASKVRRLSNEILEQMRIYKALNPRTKDLFAAMRTLMDQAGDLLSPAENTYWVLSGYAFRHLLRFGKEGQDTSHE